MAFPTCVSSPDVSGWAETVTIAGISLQPNGVLVTTAAPLPWPNVTPPGWDGPLQFTLWPVLTIDGQAYTAGCIEFWAQPGLRNGGPVCDPGQLSNNWYDKVAAPLHGYQPAPGESVGWFITAGDQRLKDIHAVTERSNIVFTPLTYGDYHFAAAPVGPVVPPPAPTPTVDPVLAALAALSAKVDAYQDENRGAFKQATAVLKKAFPWVS